MSEPLHRTERVIACNVLLVEPLLGNQESENRLALEASYQQVLGDVSTLTGCLELLFALGCSREL